MFLKIRPFFYFLLFPLFFFGREGITYTHLNYPDHSYSGYLSGPHSVHILEIDASLYNLVPYKSCDNGIGRETVLSLAKRKEAVAGINAGFFQIGGVLDGRACGSLKIKDWIALPFKPRGCMGWSFSKNQMVFDTLLVKLTATSLGESFSVDGLNRSRKKGEAILFNDSFHSTTLTGPDGIEFIIEEGQITSLHLGGSAPIPKKGFVLSLQEEHPFVNSFRAGDEITFQYEIEPQLGLTSPEEWENLDFIINGTPLLLHEGRKIVDFSSEKTIPTFLSRRHARTAIGILPNGNYLFVVVDKKSLLDGMTMKELQNLFVYLNCDMALNLDGGGSSTLVLENEILNTPRGDEEEDQGKKAVRRVSDAILVFPKS